MGMAKPIEVWARRDKEREERVQERFLKWVLEWREEHLIIW